jgi:hypothetical protein
VHLRNQVFHAKQPRVAAYLAEPSIHLLDPLSRIGQVQRGVSEHVRTVRLAAAADRAQRRRSSAMGGPLTI